MAKRTKPTPADAPTPGKPPSGKAPGVIAAIIDLLRDGGGTVEEIYGKLAERYPERASAKGGMRTTVKIQVKRLPATGKLVVNAEEVAGRGIVYTADPLAAG